MGLACRPEMRFTAAELTEIRHAFRQRLATERVPKKPARRNRKPEPPAPPVLVQEPDYDDADVLSSAQVAELFAVTPRTVRRWTDTGRFPSFRTLGGHRRYRWRDVRTPRTARVREGHRTSLCVLSFRRAWSAASSYVSSSRSAVPLHARRSPQVPVE